MMPVAVITAPSPADQWRLDDTTATVVVGRA